MGSPVRGPAHGTAVQEARDGRAGPDRESPSEAAGGFYCHLVMFIPLILVIITFKSQRKSWE